MDKVIIKSEEIKKSVSKYWCLSGAKWYQTEF